MKKEYAQYLLNKTREDYNAIAGDFSNTRRFIWKGLEPLYHYASSQDKVLDLGCGNGRLLQIFREIDIHYTGVDNSAKLIEIAKQTYPDASFLVADALQLPFEANTFDKVYSVAVLHHIPSRELRLKFLIEAKRVLSSGGLLVLTVWDLQKGKGLGSFLKYWTSKITGSSRLDLRDTFVSWAKKYDRYIHCFTKRELIRLCKDSGFSIKETGVLKMKEGGESNIFIIAQKS
jgi:ubiquinone/menaquinone biosynthesis C-methylase UbiE